MSDFISYEVYKYYFDTIQYNTCYSYVTYIIYYLLHKSIILIQNYINTKLRDKCT